MVIAGIASSVALEGVCFPSKTNMEVKIAGREEKRLLMLACLNLSMKHEEFEKVVEYGALIELSEIELRMWDGPVHYVSLQQVLNEDYATNPLHIATNISLSDKKGLSLNNNSSVN